MLTHKNFKYFLAKSHPKHKYTTDVQGPGPVAKQCRSDVWGGGGVVDRAAAYRQLILAGRKSSTSLDRHSYVNDVLAL